ncbi:MAG: sugar transferase [Vampirovibrionales bacterium]|nr:sugar transferase [Vampirovibrionales bacterium]
MSKQPSDFPQGKSIALRVLPGSRAVVREATLACDQSARDLLSAVVKLFAYDVLTLLVGATLMMMMASASLGQSPSVLALAYPLNLLLALGLSAPCRLYDLSQGRYVLGKTMVIAAVLAPANAIFFSLLGVDALTQILMLGVFALAALPTVSIHYYYAMPFSVKNTQSNYYRIEMVAKRLMDLTISFASLILLSPLLAMTWLSVRLDSPGAVLYRQTRVGFGEYSFELFKFRSMWTGERRRESRIKRHKQQQLYKMENDPRITRVGKILRKLSIDELPQLINVIRGEMSVVGPRPPLVSEFEEMNFYHRRKFEAMPGLTGLWQVAGRTRNERAFDQVAFYDVSYIENWSLMGDIFIILKTIPVVLLQKGAN